ncbi:MAG: helix-hairpin-helix domain-containing protein [Methylocystaceae bacterium]
MEKKRIIAVVSLIFLIAFAAGWFLRGSDTPREKPDLIIDTAGDNVSAAGESSKPSAKETLLWVYVVGEVKNPGVYQLPSGGRVFQAVELAEAGARADLTQLDMARVLVDGEKIRVPRQGEKLASEPIIKAASGIDSAAGSVGLVNINTASIEELDARLPGIGPSLAQRIVDYRSLHPFTRKEDIKEVSGIGDKRYESLKDLITVGP